jgi:FkbM family methyltransferase
LKLSINSTNFVARLGDIPIVNKLLRYFAHRYKDGSIVCIKRGYAAGMLWRRYHRYVNGYWVGIYELEVQKRIALELKEGDIFFDIGANAGFFSLVAAKIVGKAGQVVAFDPLPMNAQVIEEQFNINQLKQCRCICVALGRKEGMGELILPKTSKGEPSTSTAYLASVKLKNDEIMDQFQISVTTLDDFLDREGLIPAFMKIDVEGAEHDVLHGGKKLLHSARAPRIFIETHGQDVAKKVNKQLCAAGYKFLSLKGDLLANGLTERHYLACPPSFDISNLERFS